jgi:endonuclease/exonuclease/phosphatase family metal-dependent hydrolase
MYISKSNRKYTLKNKTKKNKSRHSRISILSYNISWESMEGSVKKWSLCNNNTDKTNPKHFSVCVNNVSSVFDSNNNVDFVTLQEASDYEKLINQSSRLKNMNYEKYTSGLDMVVTFWDKKYKLQDTISGEFEEGRPWLATIFTNGICLINVHMGHYSKEKEFKKMETMMLEINDYINNINKNQNQNQKQKQNQNQKQNQKQQKQKLRYIISGDFNYDIKQFGNSRYYFTLDNTTFYYNKKHILTCCINRSRHNDHVIDSLGIPMNIKIPKVNYMASDHKPILVELKE